MDRVAILYFLEILREKLLKRDLKLFRIFETYPEEIAWWTGEIPGSRVRQKKVQILALAIISVPLSATWGFIVMSGIEHYHSAWHKVIASAVIGLIIIIATFYWFLTILKFVLGAVCELHYVKMTITPWLGFCYSLIRKLICTSMSMWLASESHN